jgi:hypothetical protein
MLAALGLLACASEPEHVGHWESTYRGRGGEANGFVLRADSTMDRYKFRAFEFRFSTEGDSLRMVPILPDSFLPAGATTPPVYTNHYSVVGDTLIRSDTNYTEWLVREGPPAGDATSLLGTWKVVRSTGDKTTGGTTTGYERFRPDSVLQVRIPVDVTPGTYRLMTDPEDTLKPDSLVFFFNDDTSRCVLSWRGDTLALSRTFTNGTFTFDYVRAGQDAWYRLEKP